MKPRHTVRTNLLFLSLALTPVASQAQTTGTWIYDGATAANLKWDYSDPTTPSWESNIIPNGVGDTANFTADITAARTITLNADHTVGHLVIGDSNSTHAFTLATGSPAGSLIFDQTDSGTAMLSFPANINGDNITAPITLNDNLRVYTTSLTSAIGKGVNGIISGGGSITFDNDDGVTPAAPLQGAGQFNMNGANTFSGGVTIDDVRVATTNAKGYGTGTVTVLEGGGAWINGGLTLDNNFNLTGNGWLEGNGYLGTIRLANNVTFNGNITLGGTAGDSGGTAPDAGLFPIATSGTAVSANVNGEISGGDLLVGSMSAGSGVTTWTGSDTLTINATNTYGDSIIRPLDLPTSGQITLSVGSSTTNTTATLGSGKVYLHGAVGGKTAALRIWRGGGYTMQQDVLTSSGPGAKTAFIADVIDSGLTLNGHLIEVSEQVRLAGNAAGAILNIDAGSTVNAGQFFTGQGSGKSSTVNQTGGAVTVAGEVRVGNAATETSVWNMSDGELALPGVPAGNPYFTSGSNEDVVGKGTLYIGIDGQGIFNQSGGLVSAAAVVLDNRSNTLAGANMATGIDQYNLTGGVLSIGFDATDGNWGIQGNPSAELVFGGGTLIANTSLPIAVPMVVNGTGSEIDTSGFTVTLNSGIGGTGTLDLTDSSSSSGKVVFDLTGDATVSAALAGAAPIEKTGGGLLTLAGANTHSGTTTVTAGGLRVTGSAAGTLVIDGGTLWTGGTLTGNLSIAPTANSMIAYVGVPIAVTGNLSFGGASLSSVKPVGGGIPANGNHPLITYTGGLSGGLGNLQIDPVFASQYRQTFGLAASTNRIDLTVSGSNLSLVWNGTGSGSGTWDVGTTANWAGGEKFYVNDTVTFDDTASTGTIETVTIPADVVVLPAGMTFDNNGLDYQIDGPGSIGGSGGLLKSGTGKLTINTTNNFTGGTLIKDGGTLEVNAIGALGSGTVTVSNGKLKVLLPMSISNPLVLGDSNSGTAETILEYPNQASGNIGLSMPTVVSSAAPDSKAIIRMTASSSVTYYGGSVTLENRDVYFDNGGTVISGVTGKISGTGSIHITRSGTERVRLLNNANDFVGDVYVDSGVLQVGTGSPSGAVTSIPSGSDLIVAAGTTAGMTGSTVATVGALKGGGVVNTNTSGTGTTRLTLGNANKSGVFDGTMSNGSVANHLLALTKTGTGSQTLNGVCSFTGTTSISGGSLIVNNTYTSTVTVGAGATLGGTMTSTAAVTATATGATVAPGTSTGTMTVTGTVNLSTGGHLAIEIDDAATPMNDKLVALGTLNITNATLDVTTNGSAGQAVYIIASYGTLTGTFGTINAPGFTVDYAYDDGASTKNIALIKQTDAYLNWLDGYAALTGANRAPGMDFDGDGLNNGVEFAIGSDPTAFTGPATPGYPTATVSGGNMIYTFKRSEASKAYPVTVETTTDLATWPPANAYPIPTTDTAGPPVTVSGETVTVTIPMAPDAKKFARVMTDIPFTP